MPFFTTEFINDKGQRLEIDVQYKTQDNVVEVTDPSAWLWIHRNDALAPKVELTDAEIERIESMIQERPETWEPDSDDWIPND